MTPLPALSDVIRETLTPEVLEQIQQDGYTWSQGTAKAIILSALLLPLTEREQGLEERLTAQLTAIRTAEWNMEHSARVAAESALPSDVQALKSALHDLQQRFDLMSQSEAQETDLHLAWRAAAEAAEARVSALTAKNTKLNERLNYMHGVHQSCGDALSTEMHKVSALTAEREALLEQLRDEKIARQRLARVLSPVSDEADRIAEQEMRADASRKTQ